jgi:hypothetical protein
MKFSSEVLRSRCYDLLGFIRRRKRKENSINKLQDTWQVGATGVFQRYRLCLFFLCFICQLLAEGPDLAYSLQICFGLERHFGIASDKKGIKYSDWHIA